MKIGSLFSGVGGFDLGLERAGHEIVWQVEYDEKARSVLRRHWPDVDIHKDVCDVGRANLAGVDLICGGFPCQDLSVAGKRAGLDGARSGLWFEFHRIVSELLPTWVLIENVPGLRSSPPADRGRSGRDLAIILHGLAELGYVGAWRSLDSRYLNVAQRRERIFLLACRDPRAGCPAEVLAIAEGLSGHPAPSAEAGEAVTGGSVGGFEVAGTLGPRVSRLTTDEVANGASVVAHTLRAEVFDASEDGTGRGTPIVLASGHTNAEIGDNLAPTIAARSFKDPPISFNWQSGGDVRHDVRHDETGALHVGQTPAVYRKAQKAHDADDCERWEHAEHANTLAGHSTTSSEVALAYGFNGDQSEKTRSMGEAAGESPTLRAGANCHTAGATVPRRLTPRECERLQGFPDDWTRWDHEGNELKDSPRYRMMGNAVTVNVAEWIGRRLMEAA